MLGKLNRLLWTVKNNSSRSICVCRSGSVWRTPRGSYGSSNVRMKEGPQASRGVWLAVSVQSASSLNCTFQILVPATAISVTCDLWIFDPPWWSRSTRSLSSPKRVSVNASVHQGAAVIIRHPQFASWKNNFVLGLKWKTVERHVWAV